MPPVLPSQCDSLSPRRAAFTLVELLIVIVIIAVLSGILLSAMGTMQERGNRTTCLNNLHQIGLASLAYQSDNNGAFPGPCASGCKVYYTGNQLVAPLAPYLGLPSTPTNQIVPLFRCPTWKQKATQPKTSGDNIICYITDDEVVLANGPVIQVNGYEAENGNPAKPPGRASVLASLTGQKLKTGTPAAAVVPGSTTTPTFSMTGTMYITECDQVNWAFDSTAGWYGTLPKTPVHGNIRNTLYFDMHAEARPANLIP